MKLIKFIPWVEHYPLVKPVRSMIPQWWKKGETEVIIDGVKMGNGMKSCIPFMEIMSSGYEILTPFDIHIFKDEEGNTQVKWQGPEGWEDFVGERAKELGSTIPRPAGHLPMGFIWSCKWSWKTPRGYSTFVTHPFNRFDLPFTTLNGIIDSDGFQGNGNIPFFIKEDFSGTIPEGTPFVQIFPYKRTKWKMWTDDSFNDKILIDQNTKLRQPDENGLYPWSYKKRFWKKKEF
jgi:hypothetical protein